MRVTPRDANGKAFLNSAASSSICSRRSTTSGPILRSRKTAGLQCRAAAEVPQDEQRRLPGWKRSSGNAPESRPSWPSRTTSATSAHSFYSSTAPRCGNRLRAGPRLQRADPIRTSTRTTSTWPPSAPRSRASSSCGGRSWTKTSSPSASRNCSTATASGSSSADPVWLQFDKYRPLPFTPLLGLLL